MKHILPNKITIEPEDAYMAVLRFLDKYNEILKSDELRSLVGEMIQVHIAQSTYRLWLEIFIGVIITEETFKSTLPEKVTVRPKDVYGAIITFLKEYNDNLQSAELNDAAAGMIPIDQSNRIYVLWLETFKEILIEYGVLEKE